MIILVHKIGWCNGPCMSRGVGIDRAWPAPDAAPGIYGRFRSGGSLLVIAQAVALGWACAAHAQPPAEAAGEPEEPIVVTADASERTLIDRQTYIVRDTPEAQTRTAVDVLQTLPSVSVDARGRLQLLGDGNVKILIDGRPVPDAAVQLRTMQASQIARIEVITNPSAEFAADGTAGVINIVLRRTFKSGLGGSVSGSAANPGSYDLKLSPTWSRGRWSASASPGFSVYRGRSRSFLERTGPLASEDGTANRTELAVERSDGRQIGGRAQITYKPDDRRSVSLSANAGHAVNDGVTETRIASAKGSFVPFDQIGTSDAVFNYGDLSLQYESRGKREGESLSASARLAWYDSDIRRLFVGGSSVPDAAMLQVRSGDRSWSTSLKLDHKTPLGKADILSIGGEVERNDSTYSDLEVNGLLGAPFTTSSIVSGAWIDASAYVTFQTTHGAWKLLPGLRVEGRSYAFDQGIGGDPASYVDLFPSLHVERRFDDKLKAIASYSRRVDWPSLLQLAPVRRFNSPTSATVGNPALRPATTDAAELSVNWKIGKQDLAATAYRRATSSTIDSLRELTPDGIILSIPINGGTRKSMGGEMSLRGPVGNRWRYTVSGDIADVTLSRFDEAFVARTFNHSGKAQLEYADAERGKRGFDQVTLNLQYQGPQQFFQTRISGFWDADVSWTHQITDKTASVVSISRLFGGLTIISRVDTQDFIERQTFDIHGPVVKVALSHRLGGR